MTGLLLFPPPWSLPPWWSGSLTVTVWVHSILGQGREDSSWRSLEISNLIGHSLSIVNKSSPAHLRTPANPAPGLAPWLRSIESRSGTRYTIPRLASHSPPIVVTAHDPASSLLPTDQQLKHANYKNSNLPSLVVTAWPSSFSRQLQLLASPAPGTVTSSRTAKV